MIAADDVDKWDDMRAVPVILVVVETVAIVGLVERV